MGYIRPGSSVHGILPIKKTRVGCHSLLQALFQTQRSNPGLFHCRQTLYCLSHHGSPSPGYTVEAPRFSHAWSHIQRKQAGCAPHRSATERSYPTSEVRGGGERSNNTCKEQRLRGRRGAERSYSAFKVRRGGRERYSASKVRSSGCALLEQPWRDNSHPR